MFPVSRGGRDSCENVAKACKRCNAGKGSSVTRAYNMDLLALPYRPNHAGYLALSYSGRILGNQKTFLSKRFSSNSRFLSR